MYIVMKVKCIYEKKLLIFISSHTISVEIGSRGKCTSFLLTLIKKDFYAGAKICIKCKSLGDMTDTEMKINYGI